MSDTPVYDQLRLAGEMKARTRPADASNAVPLPPAEHQALIGRLGRDLAAFARPGFRTARDMHQALERAAQADQDRSA